jgi:WD40 repeat protein
LIADSKTPIALKILDQERPRPGEPDLRDFSWYYLYQRCHTERRTLAGHRGDVHHVEFSPRGDLLASAGKDGTVRLWSTTTWEPLRTIQASLKEVNVAAFSPDGQTLATVDDEGKLKLWETNSGHLRLERLAHKGDTVIARFTPDGETVITGGRNDGFIRLWDRGTGDARGGFQASPSELENAAISPDGSILATVGARIVKLWRLSDRTLIAPVGVGVGAQGVAFSHDGTKLATVDEGDGLVRIWDVSTREIGHALAGHTKGIFAVAFLADDRTVISAGDDAAIRFWNVTIGFNMGIRSGHTDRIWSLALSPDGHTIASAGKDGSVKLWDARPSPGYLRLPIANPFCFELLDDCRTLISLEHSDLWYVGRWDLHSGSLLERKPILINGDYSFAAFSRDGQWLALSDREDRHTLWNIATGKRRDILDPELGGRHLPLFSPNSRFLAFANEGFGPSSILDLESDREILFPCEKLVGPAFTPSNEAIAALPDGSVCWWNPRTGRSKQSTAGHYDVLTGYPAISADGRILATAQPQSRKIYLHSSESLELIKELPAQPAFVGPLAFSPDGRILASIVGDRTVKIWDIRTGEQLLSLGGLSRTAVALRFSSDGRILATFTPGEPLNPHNLLLWGAAEIEP